MGIRSNSLNDGAPALSETEYMIRLEKETHINVIRKKRGRPQGSRKGEKRSIGMSSLQIEKKEILILFD